MNSLMQLQTQASRVTRTREQLHSKHRVSRFDCRKLNNNLQDTRYKKLSLRQFTYEFDNISSSELFSDKQV